MFLTSNTTAQKMGFAHTFFLVAVAAVALPNRAVMATKNLKFREDCKARGFLEKADSSNDYPATNPKEETVFSTVIGLFSTLTSFFDINRRDRFFDINQPKVMLSGRFDGGLKEAVIYGVARELQELIGEENVLFVKKEGQTNFDQQVQKALYQMDVMVALGSPDYGEKTPSSYCTFYELRYANENNKPILPLQLYSETQDAPWPPAAVRKAPHNCLDCAPKKKGAKQPDCDCGKIQNKFILTEALFRDFFTDVLDEPGFGHLSGKSADSILKDWAGLFSTKKGDENVSFKDRMKQIAELIQKRATELKKSRDGAAEKFAD